LKIFPGGETPGPVFTKGGWGGKELKGSSYLYRKGRGKDRGEGATVERDEGEVAARS